MTEAENAIEQAIAQATGRFARTVDSRDIGGGCINQSRMLSLDDGRRYFVKSQYRPGFQDVFEVEYQSLQLLAQSGALAVPLPVAYGLDFLVLEVFERGDPASDWQEQVGRGLARLQQFSPRPRYGFERDTYLGTTLQVNRWCDSWLEFWREHRLGWQLRKLGEQYPGDDSLLQQGEKLLSRLDTILIEPDEGAVLLHGDLWSGNAAATDKGAPVIFDPACYFGHREAEFGMMRLFGGFGPRCEAAYCEIWPLEPGFEWRVLLYRLYHEINHVILFGGGYYAQCLSTMNNLL